CTGLYIAMGVMALVLSGLLFVFFDTTYAIPAGLRLEARVSFALAALAVAGGFVAMLPEAVMAAHHDFVIRNAFVIGILLVRFGVTIGLLVLTPSFVVLAAVQIIGPAIDFTVCLLLVHRRYPGVRIGLSSFQWDVVRTVFSFSIYVPVLNAAGRLALQTDPPALHRLVDRRLVRGPRRRRAPDPHDLEPDLPARARRRPARADGAGKARAAVAHVPGRRRAQPRPQSRPGWAARAGRCRAGDRHSQRPLRGGRADRGLSGARHRPVRVPPLRRAAHRARGAARPDRAAVVQARARGAQPGRTGDRRRERLLPVRGALSLRRVPELSLSRPARRSGPPGRPEPMMTALTSVLEVAAGFLGLLL